MPESVESLRAAIRALPLGMRSAVRLDTENGCILWIAGTDPKGYGRVSNLFGEVLAHRAVWMAAHGAIPRGVRIEHRCEREACVRLEHLRVAQPVVRGKPGPRAKALCKRGHDLTDPANVWVGKSGKRTCRACNRLRRREFDRKRRAEAVATR